MITITHPIHNYAVTTYGILPDQTDTYTVPVDKASIPTDGNYLSGVKLHALLTRIRDHDPLSKEEKALLPWLNSMRNGLREKGVSFIAPEVTLYAPAEERLTRCDLLLFGGLAKLGVCELKVTNLPEQPLVEHFDQLAAYCDRVSRNFHSKRVWGVLAYASIADCRIRMFSYLDLTKRAFVAASTMAA